MRTSKISDRLRRILRDDAQLMDDYGDSLGRAATAIDRLRTSLDDAILSLESIAKSNDSDYAKPDLDEIKWLREVMEATQ